MFAMNSAFLNHQPLSPGVPRGEPEESAACRGGGQQHPGGQAPSGNMPHHSLALSKEN
jgi:hypothetical protein